MAAKNKYKKLTAREKKFNKEFRERLRESGVLPPVKTRLNRKNFSQEVNVEFEESFKRFSDQSYLYEAIAWMNPGKDPKLKITPEQVGVLKVLKLAMALKKFHEEIRARGETEYKVGDLFEIVNPILKL